MDQAKNDVRMALETAIREAEERLLPQRSDDEEQEQRMACNMAISHMIQARFWLEKV